MQYAEILNRAADFHLVLTKCEGDIDWEKLRAARTDVDLELAFKRVLSFYVENKFRPRFALMLRIVGEPQFPKGSQKAQIRFLADSLGGDGVVSPRRSRDICLKVRIQPENEIIRREYYIECTCGYDGPALHGGCPACGTRSKSLYASLSPDSEIKAI
jgi:hypothetical protein